MNVCELKSLLNIEVVSNSWEENIFCLEVLWKTINYKILKCDLINVKSWELSIDVSDSLWSKKPVRTVLHLIEIMRRVKVDKIIGCIRKIRFYEFEGLSLIIFDVSWVILIDVAYCSFFLESKNWALNLIADSILCLLLVINVDKMLDIILSVSRNSSPCVWIVHSDACIVSSFWSIVVKNVSWNDDRWNDQSSSC